MDPGALILKKRGQQSPLQDQSMLEYLGIALGSALDVEPVGGVEMGMG